MLTLPIAQPPWTQSGKRLESMFRKAIHEYDLLEGIDKLGIALSGGKDSLTLLYLLCAIRGHGMANFEITAFHVNGEFSCGASIQKDFLAKICTQLNVELVTLEQNTKLEEMSCYPCSRERRRLLFDGAKSKGITTLAFGHHRDDAVQTLLMNLFHKGEFASNLPKIFMQNYGITIIRPLIYISEQEIVQFANAYGYNRILCRCPVGQNSMRKKTDQLLNYIEKTFPEVRSNLASAGRLYGSNKAATP